MYLEDQQRKKRNKKSKESQIIIEYVINVHKLSNLSCKDLVKFTKKTTVRESTTPLTLPRLFLFSHDVSADRGSIACRTIFLATSAVGALEKIFIK